MSDGGAVVALVAGEIDQVEPAPNARKARRLALIAARKCIQCRAGLLELVGVRCQECARKHRDHAATPRARKMAYVCRALRPSRGLCIDCPDPVEPGRNRCRVHLDYHAHRQQLYLARLNGEPVEVGA